MNRELANLRAGPKVSRKRKQDDYGGAVDAFTPAYQGAQFWYAKMKAQLEAERAKKQSLLKDAPDDVRTKVMLKHGLNPEAQVAPFHIRQKIEDDDCALDRDDV